MSCRKQKTLQCPHCRRHNVSKGTDFKHISANNKIFGSIFKLKNVFLCPSADIQTFRNNLTAKFYANDNEAQTIHCSSKSKPSRHKIISIDIKKLEENMNLSDREKTKIRHILHTLKCDSDENKHICEAMTDKKTTQPTNKITTKKNNAMLKTKNNGMKLHKMKSKSQKCQILNKTENETQHIECSKCKLFDSMNILNNPEKKKENIPPSTITVPDRELLQSLIQYDPDVFHADLKKLRIQKTSECVNKILSQNHNININNIQMKYLKPTYVIQYNTSGNDNGEKNKRYSQRALEAHLGQKPCPIYQERRSMRTTIHYHPSFEYLIEAGPDTEDLMKEIQEIKSLQTQGEKVMISENQTQKASTLQMQEKDNTFTSQEVDVDKVWGGQTPLPNKHPGERDKRYSQRTLEAHLGQKSCPMYQERRSMRKTIHYHPSFEYLIGAGPDTEDMMLEIQEKKSLQAQGGKLMISQSQKEKASTSQKQEEKNTCTSQEVDVDKVWVGQTPPSDCQPGERDKRYSLRTLEAHLGRKPCPMYQERQSIRTTMQYHPPSFDHIIGTGPFTEDMVKEMQERKSLQAQEKKVRISQNQEEKVLTSQTQGKENTSTSQEVNVEKIWVEQNHLPNYHLDTGVQDLPRSEHQCVNNDSSTKNIPKKHNSKCKGVKNFIRKCFCLSGETNSEEEIENSAPIGRPKKQVVFKRITEEDFCTTIDCRKKGRIL